MYCPDCPVTLELYAFGKSYLVDPGVEMKCSEHIFHTDIEVVTQPGKGSLEVSTFFYVGK